MHLRNLTHILPGLTLCAVLGVGAAALGRTIPTVGAAIFALSFGLAARALLGLRPRSHAARAAGEGIGQGGTRSPAAESRSAPPAALNPGAAFAAKPLLQAAIVLLGAKTSLDKVAAVGAESLLVMLASLGSAFLVAVLLGKALRVEPKLAALIGTGTAICGGSAIAAAAPVLEAEESDTAYAFSVIFAFNLVAVFAFPALGALLGLSDRGFGLWAGTAINDTSSVVAAGYSWSPAAGDYAVVVKLARTAMIVPVTLALSLLAARGAFGSARPAPVSAAGKDASGAPGGPVAAPAERPARRAGKAASLPWFIPAFLLASLARSLGLIPAELGARLAAAGVVLIAMALAGIGLMTDFRRIGKTGWKPLVLGLAVWAAVALSSLGVQAALGLG